jgi:hypothetical protein
MTNNIRLTLRRITFNTGGPTYGVLMMHDIPLCVTLERPWLDNKPKISCIPPGLYKCVPHSGEKFKDVWMLEDVPGRTAILIHAGNTTKDTEGCILVGRAFFAGGITSSMPVLDELRKTLPENFTLEIINP